MWTSKLTNLFLKHPQRYKIKAQQDQPRQPEIWKTLDTHWTSKGKQTKSLTQPIRTKYQFSHKQYPIYQPNTFKQQWRQPSIIMNFQVFSSRYFLKTSMLLIWTPFHFHFLGNPVGCNWYLIHLKCEPYFIFQNAFRLNYISVCLTCSCMDNPEKQQVE